MRALLAVVGLAASAGVSAADEFVVWSATKGQPAVAWRKSAKAYPTEDGAYAAAATAAAADTVAEARVLKATDPAPKSDGLLMAGRTAEMPAKEGGPPQRYTFRKDGTVSYTVLGKKVFRYTVVGDIVVIVDVRLDKKDGKDVALVSDQHFQFGKNKIGHEKLDLVKTWDRAKQKWDDSSPGWVRFWFVESEDGSDNYLVWTANKAGTPAAPGALAWSASGPGYATEDEAYVVAAKAAKEPGVEDVRVTLRSRKGMMQEVPSLAGRTIVQQGPKVDPQMAVKFTFNKDATVSGFGRKTYRYMIDGTDLVLFDDKFKPNVFDQYYRLSIGRDGYEVYKGWSRETKNWGTFSGDSNFYKLADAK